MSTSRLNPGPGPKLKTTKPKQIGKTSSFNRKPGLKQEITQQPNKIVIQRKKKTKTTKYLETPDFDVFLFEHHKLHKHEHDVIELDESTNKEDYRKKALKYCINDWATNTTCHGVVNMFQAKGKVKTFLWTSTFAISWISTSYLLINILSRYFEYKVDISKDFFSVSAVEIPAITFCNNNPIRRSKIGLMPEAQAKEVLFITWENRDNIGPAETNETTLYEKMNSTLKRRQLGRQFRQYFAAYNKSLRQEMGHQLEDMLVGCSFEQRPCNLSMFQLYQSVRYGNCYTFNSKEPALKLRTPGPKHGLIVELFIDQGEYVPELTTKAGFRFNIHVRGETHFLDEDSILISPNTFATISVTETHIEKAEAPYGSKCRNLSLEEREKIDMFVGGPDNLKYTVKGCLETCKQKRLVNKCGCGYPLNPLRAKAFGNLNGDPLKPCQIEELDRCIEEIRLEYRSPDQCHCPKMCSEKVHRTKASFGKWPVGGSEGILRVISSNNTYVKNQLDIEETDPNATPIRDQFIRVSVFYNSFENEDSFEIAEYPASQVLADLGGSYGIFLGLSIIGILEFNEMLLDVAMVFFGHVMKSTVIRKRQEEENVPTEIS